jgi:hypothetical protein
VIPAPAMLNTLQGLHRHAVKKGAGGRSSDPPRNIRDLRPGYLPAGTFPSTPWT